MVRVVQLWLMVAILGVSACARSGGGDEGRAVRTAIDYAISESRGSDRHVVLNRENLKVTRVTAEAGGGWMVFLRQGTCEYIIFAWPGHEVDNAGIGAGCITSEGRKAPRDARRRVQGRGRHSD